jgi:NAD(P)-dependent dehydrogenase (short-subunit alcohol dehydrogenase family)
MTTPFRYEGRRVLLTGSASGVGAATLAMLAEAGAEIHALDLKPTGGPVASFTETNMGDPAAIDAAVAKIGGPIHGLFNVAGIPGTRGMRDVMKVNLLGLRHLTEQVIPLMPEGSAIANVASIAGGQWATHLAQIQELLATPDFAAGQAWCEAQDAELLGDGYAFSKECVQVYTMLRAKELIQRGIRINSICPGPIETPIMPEFRESVGSGTIDWTVNQVIGRLSRPEEHAPPLLFLNSREASYISGHNLITDAGFSGAMTTGQLDFSALSG